ncbi:MAG: pyridoxamine 5'-phosphate oxidase family protein [Paracoccaceae bacterium]|nr:pyridoxamine 5'-phosphate oxidase family protein [Paracoccaceae bacterium]
MPDPDPTTPSPFHEGEKTLQVRAGKREAIEAFGRRAIRPFMPDQHRSFFATLPFLVVGSMDDGGRPWASILARRPGFVQSPSNTRLDVKAMPVKDDPLAKNLKTGAAIGILGIDLGTRRRNRMNARVASVKSGSFSLEVDQSFGNCPQYIQTRDIDFVRDTAMGHDSAPTERFDTLDNTKRAWIGQADMFFVASGVHPSDDPARQGVDVSHRGGRAGFVKVEGNTLTIPDYSGNYLFNTLGNFLINPKAGLTFIDFSTGDVLSLTGTVELLGEDDPEISAFRGAERGWRFTLAHGVQMFDALPLRARFGEWSPGSLLAGDWAETAKQLKAEAERDIWRRFVVSRIVDESSVIRSFYLEPEDATPVPNFEPGQFLTVRATPRGMHEAILRTYTVSSAPSDSGYRISIKHELDGQMSNHLHTGLKVGDTIDVKAPKGNFTLDPAETRPAVLIGGGVGITPMISMARQVVHHATRTRHLRPMTIYHSASNTMQRAFRDEFLVLSAQSDGAIQYHSLISNPARDETRGQDFDHVGRVNADMIRNTLLLEDCDYYICGPAEFMQATYSALRSVGVCDQRIKAEAFGPAALQRRPDDPAVLRQVDEAETAVVRFAKSHVEQPWHAGDASLLDTAEAHGLKPDFSCRNGVCGSCATRKSAGEVVYRTPPTAEIGVDEILLCCAVPAKGTEVLELDL